jgi:hypothetical protein
MLETTYEVDVLVILFTVAKKLSGDDSQRTTVPVKLVIDNVVVLIPEQTFTPPPVMVPVDDPDTVRFLVKNGV